MGEFSDRLLGPGPVRQPSQTVPPLPGAVQGAPPAITPPVAPPGQPPLLGADGQPVRLPQTPDESRFSERLLGSRTNSFAVPGADEFGTATQVEFDFPDINQIEIPGLTVGQKAGATGLLFAMDEAQQIDIIRANIPGAELNRDKFGNLFVNIPGASSPAYINRPGPSPQDVTQLAAMIGPGVLAGRAGAAAGTLVLGRLVGAPAARVAGVAAGEAALSAGTDLALRAVGSEQPVNVGRAAAAGVFGAGGEVLFPAVARLLSGARRQGTRVFTDTAGKIELTPEAKTIISDAGLDPDTLSQDFIQRLNIEARTAASPDQAQRIAEAASLPTPVPLTRGNASRLPDDQMFEDLASKGAFGRTVQSIVQGTRDAQQTALRANVDQIQANLSGGTAQVAARGEGGALVSNAVNEIRTAADNVVNAAYDTARASGDAGIPPQAANSLADNLERAAADRLEFAPKATSSLAQFRALSDGAAGGTIDVDAMFNWRRRATTLANETGPDAATDAGALRAMIDTFDAQVVDIVESGLLIGDDATVGLWLDAIRSRREFGKVFEAVNKDAPNYLVDLLTREIPDGSRALQFEPDQAINAIFGSSNTGFIANPQLARQLSNLENVLRTGGQADAWNALREEAFARFASQAQGPFIGSTNTRSFSGANFAKALDQALERNLPIMMALFTAEERSLMQQLQRTALATTTVTAGGANFSNTAVAQTRLFNSLLGKLVGRVLGPVVQSVSDTLPLTSLPRIVQANRATTSLGPRQLGLPPGVGGGIGATVGPPATEEFQRRF